MIEPKAWWRDYSGRFSRRPFYDFQEIEVAAVDFVTQNIVDVSWPLGDDDLDVLADFATESFDRARDMSSLGFEADAVTIFSSSGLPKMILSKSLSVESMRLRRRMTIAHELGHIVLHQPLYQRDDRQLDLLQEFRTTPAYCHDALVKSSVDWCEFQASYFGGALLAPKTRIYDIFGNKRREIDARRDASPEAQIIIAKTASEFVISKDAARVRLAQLGLIVRADLEPLPISEIARGA